mmetsp:Transcript_22762/g.40693  ORF Transcript_22762/g.40693 Transcript_22762/m.40693 type:complete len:206 (-) Transcript_22762:297-914(-)
MHQKRRSSIQLQPVTRQALEVDRCRSCLGKVSQLQPAVIVGSPQPGRNLVFDEVSPNEVHRETLGGEVSSLPLAGQRPGTGSQGRAICDENDIPAVPGSCRLQCDLSTTTALGKHVNNLMWRDSELVKEQLGRNIHEAAGIQPQAEVAQALAKLVVLAAVRAVPLHQDRSLQGAACTAEVLQHRGVFWRPLAKKGVGVHEAVDLL